MAKGRKTGGRNFKKGQGGRKKTAPELEGMPRISRDDISRIVAKLSDMTRPELTAHLADLTTKTLEVMIGNIIVQAVNKGDHQKAEFLLARTIGKVPDNINLNDGTSLHGQLLAAIDKINNAD